MSKIQDIIDSLKNIEIPHLKSLSTIGSFNYANELGYLEDIDIYLIVDRVGVDSYKKIVNNFVSLAEKLSDESYIFIAEFRAGPIKPKGIYGKKVIQLHILINEVDKVGDKSPMVALDWKLNSKTIKGKSVNTYLTTTSFTPQELIESKDGLKFYLELIDKSEVSYKERFINEDGELEKRTVTSPLNSELEWFEFLQAIVLTSFLNFMRLTNPTAKKDFNLMQEIAKNKLDPSQAEFLSEIILLKKEYKAAKEIIIDIESLKNKTKEFVNVLISLASHS